MSSMDLDSLQYTTLSHNTDPHLVRQINQLTPSDSSDSQTILTLCVVDPSADQSFNLVGYTSYTISNAPSKPRSRGLLVKSIFVQPNSRRQKVGRSLVSRVRQFATKEKCNAIYVETGDNEVAKGFLKRNGFEEWNTGGEEEQTGKGLMWHAVALF